MEDRTDYQLQCQWEKEQTEFEKRLNDARGDLELMAVDIVDELLKLAKSYDVDEDSLHEELTEVMNTRDVWKTARARHKA